MFRRIAAFLVIACAAPPASQAAALVATRTVQTAPVVAVQSTRVADVVLLGAGFEAGLRQGMVLSIIRAGAPVAELVLVDLRPRAAAGLILQLSPGQSIRAGDAATVKTLKT